MEFTHLNVNKSFPNIEKSKKAYSINAFIIGSFFTINKIATGSVSDNQNQITLDELKSSLDIK